MVEYLDKANQCMICNCKPTITYLLDSDDKESRSLSSLLNMYGLKYMFKRKYDSSLNLLRGRVAPIQCSSEIPEQPEQPEQPSPKSITDAIEYSRNSIWSHVPNNQSSEEYKHPWL